MSVALKAFSIGLISLLATVVGWFVIGYTAYTFAPTPTLIVVACWGINKLAQSAALSLLKEIKPLMKDKQNE